MSAVPPELPEVSGRSRAPFKKGSAALVTRGAAAHLLAAALAAHRVQVAAPGGSFAQRPPTARSKCRVLWKRPGCVTFSDLCFSVVIKIAQVGGFVNRKLRGLRSAAPPPDLRPPAARRRGPRSGCCRGHRSR